ncbi:MAG: serine/threonine protein kinase [Akkermansiaceae bacterium]|nr:serine/threonine protein kinase [Akkermansiaceae bacterium]MCP5542671.1 serine/threonine protein kinase [Akkermansiaceae bacterium]
MNPSRQIEQAVFEVAAAIDAGDVREAFLEKVCNGDEGQRRRLDGLLSAHDKAEDFFREAVGARTVVAAEVCKTLMEDGPGEIHEPLEDPEGPGKTIGNYFIEKRIGEGGCGVVYLAAQREPVRRKVALKVIRLGMDTERVIARFEMERQSLAVMDHPFIAQVLDAGTTDGGRPYFVMEWVRGERITDYCDHNHLPVARRIDLFIQVCGAIQHAHQKGVIHRDIKPSNILVSEHDGQATPKVIDFGIAKATASAPGTDTRYTAAEPFIGTPAYMSPEQADRRSVDIDTRSDVYSLGALLYELLTGRPPFDPKTLSDAGVTEMRRLLMESPVPPPSEVLRSMMRKDLDEAAARCGSDGHRLISLIAGDLDWIVMKALEKDRARRYETVGAFVLDLHSFIANEPVSARPPSRIYLLNKFVRRNRVACLTSLAIVASLVLGFGFAYYSFLRERGARQEQARLRAISETARANEAHLRKLSMARENMAQVAALLSEGKTEDADEMLRHSPLSEIEPSLEAANVLRSLGSWNAMRGRWDQAADCYLLLTQANRFSDQNDMISREDLVAAGPALAEDGDRAKYDRYRDWVLARFRDTDAYLHAQQALQATLLRPASPGFLEELEPFRLLLEKVEYEKDNLKPGWEVERAGWCAWSNALLCHRRGEFEKALYWGELALGYQISKQAFSASVHPLLAMAHHQLGHAEAARRELDNAREWIKYAFKPELVPAYEPLGKENGYWWDWVQARLLFREAEAMFRGKSG